MNICQIQPTASTPSETFLTSQAINLGAGVIYDLSVIPKIGNKPILSQKLISRLKRKIIRNVRRENWDFEIESAIAAGIKKLKADIVLAQYGPTGVTVLNVCQELRMPLVVYFHGYDASRYQVIEKYRRKYLEVFSYASAIVVVSKKMVEDLIHLGAPENKIFLNPTGVDIDFFTPSTPIHSDPILLAVGRFTDKKAPHLTILAFSEVIKKYPDARLEMIGDGPLLGACKDLCLALKLTDVVRFHGVQNSDFIRKKMQTARAFVQHSVKALDGDCEGTPGAILEALASNLPVVSTMHAGIPDVVRHGVEGFLVEERDINAMASAMMKLVESPELAQEIGENGRRRILENYTIKHNINNLRKIFELALQPRF